MTTKEVVIEMIRQMPDDVSVSDILHELSLRQEIEKGLSQLDAGQGIKHEEAMKRFEQWLK